MKGSGNKILPLSLLISLFAICLLVAKPVQAATFCVSDAAGLQAALSEAASNGEDDTVQIVQGTYEGNFVYSSTEAYGVTIEGSYTPGCISREVNPANTVLNGGATRTVLALSCPGHAVEFMVDGLTLQNGVATNDYGGGLFAKTAVGGKLTLINNHISDNSAYSRGGGVYVSSTTVVLTNNNLTGNLAEKENGGGIYVSATTATFTNNTISANRADWLDGGGVYVNATSIFFTNNIINGNSAESLRGGGGVYANAKNIVFTKNTISGNWTEWVGSGGGIYVSATTLTFTNNTISGNSTGLDTWWDSGSGGGIYASGTTATLTNNTISANSAGYGSSGGGGIHLSFQDNVEIYNNIIWNNISEGDGADLYIDNDVNGDFVPSPVALFNNDFDHTAAGIYIQIPFTIDSSNLNNADPIFVYAANEDYHLTESSPCINAGDNDAPDLPSTDKDGNPRIFGETVDMGVYEYQYILYVEPEGLCGGKIPCYSTIQAGISAARSETIIKIAEGVYDEGVTLDQSKNLILQCGWDPNFTSQSSQTTADSMTISGGTIEVDKIVLQ